LGSKVFFLSKISEKSRKDHENVRIFEKIRLVHDPLINWLDKSLYKRSDFGVSKTFLA